MKKRLLWVVMALVLVASGVAYADMVEGEVVSVDLTGNMLEVAKTDAATGTTENLTISVDDATAYSGEVTALAEVVEGDQVKLEVEKDAATGNWMAKSVDVSVIE